MKQLLLLTLGLSACAWAGKIPFDVTLENTTLLNPACPVTLTGVYADPPKGAAARMSVHFVNQGERRIIAAKFAFVGLDAVRDEHPFPHDYAFAVNVRPDKQAKPVWKVHDDEMAEEIASGIRVVLLKLMYANGSTWVDDGTRSCSMTLAGKPGKRRVPED